MAKEVQVSSFSISLFFLDVSSSFVGFVSVLVRSSCTRAGAEGGLLRTSTLARESASEAGDE